MHLSGTIFSGGIIHIWLSIEYLQQQWTVYEINFSTHVHSNKVSHGYVSNTLNRFWLCFTAMYFDFAVDLTYNIALVLL